MGKIRAISVLNAWLSLITGWSLITGQAVGQPTSDSDPSDIIWVIDSVVLSGNKITRDYILFRELVFRSGDTIGSRQLDSLIVRSRENLINTSLFNFVHIQRYASAGAPYIQNILVEVTERWYVWPIPILKISDRNFNVWWETKDFSRLSYGFFIDWRNFRGRKENLLMRFQFGYDQLYDLHYLIPYVNRRKTVGLSFGGGFWKRKETASMTLENKQVFFQDPGSFARQDIFAFGQCLLRPNIHNTHLFELRYDHHQFSDSLLHENEDYSVNGAREVQYMTFHYMFKSDHRDYNNYPLKGYYADFEVIKKGLWTFSENTLDNLYFLATFRKFWELYPGIYFASGVNGKVSAGRTQPYFALRGIGFDRDIVRSYEYYVVDAEHFGIWKNNFKFALISQKTGDIDFIRTEKFSKVYYALYLNVFLDAGYGAYDQDFGTETNDLQNALLMGYGAGLDFVTYYDIVIRLEFSVNILNEPGIFLHFRAPI